MSLGRLAAVSLVGDLRLNLQWDDGRSADVDLSGIIGRRAALRPLRNAETFATARLSDDGWSLEWPNAGIDFGAQQLRRWADEQGGEAMPLASFLDWVARHELTSAGAARALGLSVQEVEAFTSGELQIPKTVMLATEGYDGRRAA